MVSKPDAKRVAVFQPEFLEDLSYWVETERRTAKRLLELVKAVLRDPFKGIGSPEPLKCLGSDVRSRRVTQEHRCVYLVKADRIEFLQGRFTIDFENPGGAILRSGLSFAHRLFRPLLSPEVGRPGELAPGCRPGASHAGRSR